MDDEEESPVVKEIPVYLCHSLSDQLVLYQYPLERGIFTTDVADIIDCKIKANPHEVQLSLGLNTSSTNYCSSRGEQIAINVDGRSSIIKNPEDVVFPRQIMDKQTLYSRCLTNQNCAVGVLHDNELHITPVDRIALLRPGFKYLDKSDKRAKTEAKEGGDVDMSGDEEEEMKQVTVKFARQETERTKKARERSFGYVSKKTAKEAWYRSNYYNKGTDKSELELNKLYCHKLNERTGDIKQDISQLLTDITKDDEEASINSSHGDSLTRIRSLSLFDRIKKLLLDAKLLQFNQIKTLLACSSNEISDCLRVAQQVAVLVQGCWVIQSEILYSKDIVLDGIQSTHVKNARDCILYLFSKNSAVSRKKIMELVKLPADVLKKILEDIAVLNSDKEWQFLLPTDVEFIKSYPDVSERQFKKWELKYDKLLLSFKNTETNLSTASPTRQRRKSFRESSISSDNESGAEVVKKNIFHFNNKIRRTKKHSVSFSDKVSFSDGGVTPTDNT